MRALGDVLVAASAAYGARALEKPEGMSTEAPPNVIERLQRQLISPETGLQDYIATARRLGHSMNIILFVTPDGKLGKPKVNIDTRSDTREGRH